MWLLGKCRLDNTECKHTGQAKYILKKERERPQKSSLKLSNRSSIDFIRKNVLEESQSLCLIHGAETVSQGEHLVGTLYTSKSSLEHICKCFANKLKCEPWSENDKSHTKYTNMCLKVGVGIS